MNTETEVSNKISNYGHKEYKALQQLNNEVKELQEKIDEINHKKSIKKDFLGKISPILFGLFLCVIVFICAICVVISTCSFTSNQNDRSSAFEIVCKNISKSVDKIGEMLTDQKKQDTSEYEDNIEKLVVYVERLQKTQKEASKNDVMSFVFSMLSSVLVGVCAALVSKSYNNLREIKSISDEAKDIALKAKNDSKEVLNYVRRIEHTAYDAEIYSFVASENAENARDSFLQQEKIQKSALDIQGIYIEILFASNALSLKDRSKLRDYIKSISEKILSLKDIDETVVFDLQQKLIKLGDSIEEYSEYIENTALNNKESYKKSVEFFKESINEAINHCGRLSNNLS